MWKNLVESAKNWKIWWKVGKFGKSLKSGKICFGKFVKSLENLSKNEKILKRQKMKNWKILEKPGGKWQNMKTLLESGKIWKTWWKVGKFGKSLKSGKILNLWNFGKSVKKWKNIEKAKNRQLENSGKTCWKVEKCVKPGGKWKNFVEKVWKVEKFVKMCETLENLKIYQKMKKYWNGKKWKTGKFWKNLLKSGKIWKTWWKVGKFCKSLKSGKIC